MPIPLETCKPEILLDRLSVHLLWIDMVDFKSRGIVVLRHLAVFTAMPRSLPDDPSQSDRNAHEAAFRIEIRARD